MDTSTTIQLTEDDALLFVKFQKRYAFIKLMEELGVFELRSGSVKIHFDNIGGIGSIVVEKHYKPN